MMVWNFKQKETISNYHKHRNLETSLNIYFTYFKKESVPRRLFFAVFMKMHIFAKHISNIETQRQ